MTDRVSLTLVYEWTCFDCGRNCLVRVPATDDLYSEEEIRDIYAQLGFDIDEDDIELDLRPVSVKCDHCESIFEVEDGTTKFDDFDPA